jgi:hypothetical protein
MDFHSDQFVLAVSESLACRFVDVKYIALFGDPEGLFVDVVQSELNQSEPTFDDFFVGHIFGGADYGIDFSALAGYGNLGDCYGSLLTGMIRGALLERDRRLASDDFFIALDAALNFA